MLNIVFRAYAVALLILVCVAQAAQAQEYPRSSLEDLAVELFSDCSTDGLCARVSAVESSLVDVRESVDTDLKDDCDEDAEDFDASVCRATLDDVDERIKRSRALSKEYLEWKASVTELLTTVPGLAARVLAVKEAIAVVETLRGRVEAQGRKLEELSEEVEVLQTNISSNEEAINMLESAGSRGFCLDFGLGGFAGGAPFGEAAQSVFAPMQFRGVRAGLQLGAGIGYCTDSFRVGFGGGFVFDGPDRSIGAYAEMDALWRVQDRIVSIGPVGRFEFLERRYPHGVKDGQDIYVFVGPRVMVDVIRKDGFVLSGIVDGLLGYQLTSTMAETNGRATGMFSVGLRFSGTNRR